MRRSMFSFRLLLLAVVVSFLIPLAHVAAAQSSADDRDIADATAAAEEIFQLANARKFNAMYDHIHPDVHAVVPRAVAVGVFKDVYAQVQAGRAEITDARLVIWTWGVTGKRYRDAAEIDFRQPYVDENGKEQWLDDQMYLVENDGEWRWFFGSSKQFVDDAIEQYGDQEQAQPLTNGDFLQNVVNDLDEFYQAVLSYTDYEYRTPGVVIVAEGDSVQTACGPAQTGFWGFYCPPDSTLYLDEPLLIQLEEQGLDFAAAFVIAHEWAHHVQTLVTFDRITTQPTQWNEVYSIELELMADCMAGAWALDVDTRGQLEEGDVDEAVQFTIEKLGDPQYIDVYDPQAHGTAEMRETSFLNGYNEGFSGCNVVL